MALFDWFSPKNRGRILPNFENTVGEWVENLNDRVSNLEQSQGNNSQSTLQTLSDRIAALEEVNLTDRLTIDEGNIQDIKAMLQSLDVNSLSNRLSDIENNVNNLVSNNTELLGRTTTDEDTIQQLTSKGNTMAIDLSALVSAVTNEKTQESSLRTLVSQLSTTVASMAANVVDDNTKSQLADLAAQINAQSAEIVNAVNANTPASNGGSTPTPAPAPGPVVNPNAAGGTTPTDPSAVGVNTPPPAPTPADPNAVPGGTVVGPAPAPAPTNDVPANPLAGTGTSTVTATPTPVVGTPVVNPNAAPGTDPTATTISTSGTPAAPAGSGTGTNS